MSPKSRAAPYRALATASRTRCGWRSSAFASGWDAKAISDFGFRIADWRPAEPLLHVQQRDVEHQRGVGRDDAVARVAVSERGRNDEEALAADAHARQALLPALNHLPGSKHERKGRRSDGRVELKPLFV